MNQVTMKKISILFLLGAVFGMGACKKRPSAGLGGQASLNISLKHHGLLIDTGKIFIKFNSLDAPTEYDLNQDVDATDGITTIAGLKKGDYYLYANGWDPSILSKVEGGIPFSITEETNYAVLIPVTEEH